MAVQVGVLGVERDAEITQDLSLALGVGGAGLVEQIVGASEPAFHAPAPQPPPQQQVTEQRIPRGAAAPVGTPEAGRGKRQ